MVVGQEFLRSKGISIDANTVIRQATVTQLADSNGGPVMLTIWLRQLGVECCIAWTHPSAPSNVLHM